MTRTDFFVSHHQAEAGTQASLLAAALRQTGFRVFLDVDTPKAGDIATISRTGVSAARAFLVLVGNDFEERVNREGDWVAFELREARALGKPVIPILMEGVEFGSLRLPEEFSWLKLRRAYRWDRSRIHALVSEILTALEVRPPSFAVRSPRWASAVLTLLGLLGFALWAVFDAATTMRQLMVQADQRQQMLSSCEANLRAAATQLAQCRGNPSGRVAK